MGVHTGEAGIQWLDMGVLGGWGTFLRGSRNVERRKADGKMRSVIHRCPDSEGRNSFSCKGDTGIVPLGKRRRGLDRWG